MKIDSKILEIYNITELDFTLQKQAILDEWKESNQKSCERGTKIHAEFENSFYAAGDNVSLERFGIGGKFECRKNYEKLDLQNGVYPEYLIHRISDDGILCIAGQIDVLIKSGNDIIIADWKTNKTIDEKGFFDAKLKRTQKMLYPLNNLDDCNLMHYNLQLSTYAWMIQKLNPEFNIKDLIIYHVNHEDKVKQYHLPYLKTEVELMLAHHKKELIKQAQREKYKPVIY